jgi:hypothetical protein
MVTTTDPTRLSPFSTHDGIPADVISQATQHAQIQASVTAEEYQCGIAVCHDGRGWRFFSADAWIRPDEQGFLPWSPPPSNCVVRAIVDKHGRVTPPLVEGVE